MQLGCCFGKKESLRGKIDSPNWQNEKTSKMKLYIKNGRSRDLHRFSIPILFCHKGNDYKNRTYRIMIESQYNYIYAGGKMETQQVTHKKSGKDGGK